MWQRTRGWPRLCRPARASGAYCQPRLGMPARRCQKPARPPVWGTVLLWSPAHRAPAGLQEAHPQTLQDPGRTVHLLYFLTVWAHCAPAGDKWQTGRLIHLEVSVWSSARCVRRLQPWDHEHCLIGHDGPGEQARALASSACREQASEARPRASFYFATWWARVRWTPSWRRRWHRSARPSMGQCSR